MARDTSSGSDAGLDRMVALLAEVSERLAESREALEDNAEMVGKLAPAFETLAATLRGIPEGTEAAALAGARAGATEMERRLRYAASEGAKASIERLVVVEERLQRLLSDAQVRSYRRAARFRVALPLAFAAAVLAGLLLVHGAARWGIPALPAAWEWPCYALGADYVTGTSSPPQAACAIWRGPVR